MFELTSDRDLATYLPALQVTRPRRPRRGRRLPEVSVAREPGARRRAARDRIARRGTQREPGRPLCRRSAMARAALRRAVRSPRLAGPPAGTPLRSSRASSSRCNTSSPVANARVLCGRALPRASWRRGVGLTELRCANLPLAAASMPRRRPSRRAVRGLGRRATQWISVGVHEGCADPAERRSGAVRHPVTP